jgi:hypothetical protein
MATGLRGLFDVEEVEGGWLVAYHWSNTVEFVGDGVGGDGGGRPSLGKAGGGRGSGDGEYWFPVALAVVPGLGLVVREQVAVVRGLGLMVREQVVPGLGLVVREARLQVFATPDTIAMAAMSPFRVAWMVAVARAVLCRIP